MNDCENFVSLTDITQKENNENASYVIQSLIRSRNTIEFLGLWEKEICGAIVYYSNDGNSDQVIKNGLKATIVL